jgi:hypothetical protein
MGSQDTGDDEADDCDDHGKGMKRKKKNIPIIILLSH